MDDSQVNLCDTFQRYFLCCRRIGSLPWQELEQLLILQPSFVLNILEKTVNHPLCRKHPPSLQYRRLFLSELIKKHECTEAEPLDDLYSALAGVLNSEDTTVCYKSYCLPSGDTVTLSENIAIISEGTTGLVTWEAALFLAEWAIENIDIFKNRTILELGSGIGLTGLVICKSCFPKKYTFSDYHHKVLQQLKENIHCNGFVLGEEHDNLANRIKEAGSVKNDDDVQLSVIELDWESITEQQLSQFEADVVIASDVVYDPEIVIAFSKVLSKLFQCTKVGNSLEAFVASTVRSSETYRLFQATLEEAGLRWQVVTTHKKSVFANDTNSTVELLRVTSKM